MRRLSARSAWVRPRCRPPWVPHCRAQFIDRARRRRVHTICACRSITASITSSLPIPDGEGTSANRRFTLAQKLAKLRLALPEHAGRAQKCERRIQSSGIVPRNFRRRHGSQRRPPASSPDQELVARPRNCGCNSFSGRIGRKRDFFDIAVQPRRRQRAERAPTVISRLTLAAANFRPGREKAEFQPMSHSGWFRRPTALDLRIMVHKVGLQVRFRSN